MFDVSDWIGVETSLVNFKIRDIVIRSSRCYSRIRQG